MRKYIYIHNQKHDIILTLSSTKSRIILDANRSIVQITWSYNSWLFQIAFTLCVLDVQKNYEFAKCWRCIKSLPGILQLQAVQPEVHRPNRRIQLPPLCPGYVQRTIGTLFSRNPGLVVIISMNAAHLLPQNLNILLIHCQNNFRYF